MPELKLYTIEAVKRFEVHVVAESQGDAEEAFQENVSEIEYEATGVCEPDATEVSLRVLQGWDSSLPYGTERLEHDDERRDWSCREWMEESARLKALSEEAKLQGNLNLEAA